MAHNHPGNHGSDSNGPQKISIVGKVPIEYDPVALKDVSKAIRDQTTAQQQGGSASDTITQTGVEQQRRANNIARWGVWVSAAALTATVIVIFLNFKAVDVANIATKIADSTLQVYKETNRLSEKQFEIANKPYLEANNITVKLSNAEKAAHISDTITNIGNQPAKMDSLRPISGYNKEIPTFESVKKQYDTSTTPFNYAPVYLVQHYPGPAEFDIFYSDSIYKKIRTGEYAIVIFWEFKYTNLFNGKERKYQVMRAVRFNPQTKVWRNVLLYDENFDDTTADKKGTN